MFATLGQMLEESREFDADKHDYGTGYKPHFDKGGRLWMQQGAKVKLNYGPYTMTDNALSQLCSKLGPGTFGKGSGRSLPREVLSLWLADDQYAKHAAGVLNEHVDRLNPDLYVRCYEKSARAVLSTQYAAISNTQMLETTEKAVGLLEKRAGREIKPDIYNTRNTPDDLMLRFTVKGLEAFPEGEKGPYGFGLYIGNNETGRGGLQVLPLIKRTTCNNSIIIQSENVDAVLQAIHRGNVDLLADRVALAIGNALKLGTIYLNKLMAAREVELPDIFKEISDLSTKQGWSTDFSDMIRVGVEGNHSLYGLINGLTFAAHGEGVSPEQTVEVEKMAGSMLERRTRHLDIES